MGRKVPVGEVVGELVGYAYVFNQPLPLDFTVADRTQGKKYYLFIQDARTKKCSVP